MIDRDLTEREWAGLGFHEATELGGGWQSRVYRAKGATGTVAVKLIQARLVDRTVLERKTALVGALAGIERGVVASVPVCGSLVYPFGEWLVTATQFVEGEHPGHCDVSQGERLGACMGDLHRSMGELPRVELPRVAALQTCSKGPWASPEHDQLLHGDFAMSNLVFTSDGIRILDFDDCGYGPVEFDVANALYMVMFDSWINDQLPQYREFKAAFVGGYEGSTHRSIDPAAVESLMDLRVTALRRWISNPSEAPVGIRSSRPEWTDTLNRFVEAWLDRDIRR
jgi:Ser/Thr protein kinase RdoA (MazF antagonist)